MSKYTMGWNAALELVISDLSSEILRKDLSLDDLAAHFELYMVDEAVTSKSEE